MRYRVGHLLIGIGVAGMVIGVSAAPSRADLLAGINGRSLNVTYSSVWPDVTDPAVSAQPGRGNWPQEQQLQSATCARLLTFGAAGRSPVPEAATA